MTKPKLETYQFQPTINKAQEINSAIIQDRIKGHQHNLYLPHRTDFYMIYLFTEGTGNHMVDFKTIGVKEKQLLFIGNNQIHAFDSAGSYNGRSLVFTGLFFQHSERDRQFLQRTPLFDSFYSPLLINVEDIYRDILATFIAIHDELRHPSDTYQGQILHNLLSSTLLLSERQLKKNTHFPFTAKGAGPLATNFKALVEERFLERLSVAQYANELNVSVKTLQNAVSAELGKSPKEWIDSRLLLEAKRLLVYEFVSIKEVAYSLGFEEPTNFVKFFKVHTGLTPLSFRNQFQTK